MAIISRAVLGNGCILKMKRMNQRTLELIFTRSVSGGLPWRDTEALFLGTRSGGGTARRELDAS